MIIQEQKFTTVSFLRSPVIRRLRRVSSPTALSFSLFNLPHHPRHHQSFPLTRYSAYPPGRVQSTPQSDSKPALLSHDAPDMSQRGGRPSRSLAQEVEGGGEITNYNKHESGDNFTVRLLGALGLLG